jgi:DHA1 family bicyclomycin/chloramphenicol resistance-like MFS transporter
VLSITSWRGIFVGLALAAVGLWILALVALPETLPVERRQSGSVRGSLRSYHRLFRDRLFVTMVLVAGLMFATVFGYVAGAPFILQGQFGLSPQQFGVAFSANAVGMILMTQLNPVLVRRYGPIRVVSVAVVIALVSALALLANALTGIGGLGGFMVALAFVLAAAGLVMPNTPAIALNRHGDVAGTAAALLGAAQFAVGGSIAPLVGALDNGTAVPMAAILVATAGLATALFWSARRSLSAAWMP